MRISRLELAFPEGAPGRALVLGADGAEDLSPFDRAQALIVEGMAQHYDALKARGFNVATKPEGQFDTVLVTLPRTFCGGAGKTAASPCGRPAASNSAISSASARDRSPTRVIVAFAAL